MAIWRDEVTLARFEKQRLGLAQVVAKYPGRAAFLCVVEPHVKPPSDELRYASTLMVRGHGTKLKCIAVVIEASGFMGALTRSVLSGMSLLSGRQVAAQAFFATVHDAAQWLCQQLDLDPALLVDSASAHRSPVEHTVASDSVR
jgi:hypothetical protein